MSSSLIRAVFVVLLVLISSDPYHRTTILLTTTTRCSVIFLSSFNSQFAAHNHNSQHQRHLCIIYGGMYHNLYGEVDLLLIYSQFTVRLASYNSCPTSNVLGRQTSIVLASGIMLNRPLLLLLNQDHFLSNTSSIISRKHTSSFFVNEPNPCMQTRRNKRTARKDEGDCVLVRSYIYRLCLVEGVKNFAEIFWSFDH